MATDVKLNITLHKNQQHIHNNARRNMVTLAGKRFGKSKLGIYRLIQKAGRLPNGVCWAVAPFYSQAKAIIWWELNQMIPPQLIRRKIETDLFIELWNGCRIHLKGADHEDSLRGPHLDHLLMDEAAFCREHIWEKILRGQLLSSEGSGTADFISSPNPKGRSWFTAFHDTAMKRMLAGDADWSAFYFTLYDNPTLPLVEIEKLRNDLPEDTWNLEYMAIESEHAGTKYGEFDYSKHVGTIDKMENFITVRAIDWGLLHPTVCLWAKVDKVSGTIYIYDEFAKSGLVIEEVCKVIHEKTGDTNIAWSVIDPSSNRRDQITGRSVKDEFSRGNLYCVDGDRRGADNIGGRGTDIVKGMIKRGMVKIHPKCKALIYELRNLQWGDKIGDDSTDALRYLLVRLHDLVFNGVLPEKKMVEAHLVPKQTYNINDPILFPRREVEYSSTIRAELNSY